jgi:hypothetical protein
VQRKLFFERWLQVEHAINPSLIMWQNLGYSKVDRCFRIILTSLVSLILIVATMFVVLGQSAINTQINQISPQINCVDQDPSPYTLESATADKLLGKASQGILYCYCKRKLFELMDIPSLRWSDLLYQGTQLTKQFNNS